MTFDSGLTVFPTALGFVGVAWGPDGIRRLLLPRATAEDAWSALAPVNAERRRDPNALRTLAKNVQRYFGGERVEFDDPVDLAGQGSFSQEVYRAVRRVPFGGLATYGGIALQIGRPGAARAVGQALARNPVCLLVPCHRIVGAGGGLVGFGGGLELKRHLLRLERAACSSSKADPP